MPSSGLLATLRPVGRCLGIVPCDAYPQLNRSSGRCFHRRPFGYSNEKEPLAILNTVILHRLNPTEAKVLCFACDFKWHPDGAGIRIGFLVFGGFIHFESPSASGFRFPSWYYWTPLFLNCYAIHPCSCCPYCGILILIFTVGEYFENPPITYLSAFNRGKFISGWFWRSARWILFISSNTPLVFGIARLPALSTSRIWDKPK